MSCSNQNRPCCRTTEFSPQKAWSQGQQSRQSHGNGTLLEHGRPMPVQPPCRASQGLAIRREFSAGWSIFPVWKKEMTKPTQGWSIKFSRNSDYLTTLTRYNKYYDVLYNVNIYIYIYIHIVIIHTYIYTYIWSRVIVHLKPSPWF